MLQGAFMGTALVFVALVVIIVTFIALDCDRRHRKERVLADKGTGNPGVESTADASSGDSGGD